MKKLFTLLLLSCGFGLFAQTDAPDFSITDLDGVTHNLHEILDEGKVVVLDASATWCPPCWQFHEGKFLSAIHEKYGPDGTDQVRVIFYEADKDTGLDDLEGTGSNTLGDWLTDVEYPVVNESPITLNGDIYWPLGFPTINVISPNGKKIVADLYDPWAAGAGLAGMEEIIEGAFPSTSSVVELDEIEVSVYPNPFSEEIVVDLTNVTEEVSQVQVLSITGAVVKSIVVSSNVMSINTTDLASGMYILQAISDNKVVATQKLTK